MSTDPASTSSPPLPQEQVIDLVEPAFKGVGEGWRERKTTTLPASNETAQDHLSLTVSPPATIASTSSSMASASSAGDPLPVHPSSFAHIANRRQSLPDTPGLNLFPSKGAPRWILPVVACLAYSLTSMATTLSNKAIINFYSFDYPLFLTVFQNSFVVVFVWLLGQWGSISLDPLESRKVYAWVPLNMCFVAMLVTSQLSLGLISVAMVTVFKNFTTIAITLGDRIFFDNPISPSIAGSLGIMALGSFVAGYNDLEFRLDGYFYLFLNCACQTTYTLYLNKLMRTLNLSKWSMVYYNNIIAIPLLIPCFLFFRELDTILLSPAWSMPSFWVLLFLNGSCSIGISMCSFWAMGLTSPTTTSMVGSFNKIPLTILGSLMFKTPFTFIGKVSTMVGLGGALVYTWAKSRKRVEPQQRS